MADTTPGILPAISRWLRREIFQKKLMTWWGISGMVLFSLACGFLAARDIKYTALPFVLGFGMIGAVILYYCIFKPLTGFYLVTTLAFFAFYPNHLLNQDLPLSTAVDILVLFVFLGTFLNSKKTAQKRGGLMKTPVTIALLFYTLFFFMQVFNPDMHSIAGWFASVKRYLVYILIYVAAYRLVDTPDKFRFFLKFWVVFSFAAAAYGCYQQWFGLLPMEMRYIMSDPLEFKLMSQGGTIRKFSFLSDVVSFGVLSGAMAVLTLVLAVNEKEKKKKYILWFFTIIMILGMLYSGTRTTTIILPAGIGLYAFMTIQSKRTLIILFGSFMVAFFVLFAPIDTPVLNRIRSTFDTKEASLNVRDVNRHYIQPYIYKHPIGGGIATTGVEGRKFNPGHTLAGFPPDSGLLKSALETGWIGLALTILFNLFILYQGIHYHFRMRNEEYKKYIAAIIACLFSIIVTQYAQVSVGQIPSAIFIFASISLIKRLLEFDEEEQRLAKEKAPENA